MKRGTVAHMVLSVLSAEPLRVREVTERLDLRYGELALSCSPDAISDALRDLRDMQFAREVGCRKSRKLTVLTRRGEEMLDRLFEEEVVR